MKVRHRFSGQIAEVDDELGKHLVANTGEWSRVRKSPTKTDEPDLAEYLAAEAEWLASQD